MTNSNQVKNKLIQLPLNVTEQDLKLLSAVLNASLTELTAEQITMGEKVDVCVPTGNFGNILAAYYARCMGVPIRRLVCASNANNVLTDFLTTGTYDRNRPFYQTASPSMDILISSNLERLLYLLSGSDEAVRLSLIHI